MILPNFFCVGAQKAGTTTLHNVLSQHPDIYLPKSKEAHFFDFDENYSKGLAWYQKTFFHDCRSQRAIGSITPEYIFYEKAAERIYNDLGPHIKLIFILRNPVHRAYSHYLMSVSRGYETESFEKAIELEDKRIKDNEFEKLHASYISRGKYSVQIKRFLQFFPHDQMKFLVFEKDIKSNIAQTTKEVLRFLDVEDIALDCHFKSNPASTPRSTVLRDFLYKENIVKKIGKHIIPSKKMGRLLLEHLHKINRKTCAPEKLSPDFQSALIKKYFRDDIERLKDLTHEDLSHWG